MKSIFSLLSVLSIISILLFGCDEDELGGFNVKIILVDEFGKQTSLFEDGDSLIFKFYFSNNTGSDATYSNPCGGVWQYFKIYKEDSKGVYKYYSQPNYACAAIGMCLIIKDGERILLAAIPWSTEFGWPERKPGKYYVGDTLTLHINSESYDFIERIYFEIL